VKENISSTEQRILLFSVFILSLCGITYELVLGSLATYLLGNPVMQYSITIGVFLSSMGLGSYLSRFFKKNLLKTFIQIEVLLGFIGGISIIVLMGLFSFSASYYMLHVFFLVLIGMLVGLEIPLLTRILRHYGALKDILSNVLSLDYIGGLAGSLLFPLVLFPFLGRLLTCIVIGMLNIVVALVIISKMEYRGKTIKDYIFPLGSLLLLIVILLFSSNITKIMQKKLYYDDIVFSKRSKYQQIVLTRNSSDFRLYLDGSLQFSTFDEYRYHEMLVFPSVSLNPSNKKKVLIMGGGDGLAVRELLKRKDVSSITLVELDNEIVKLAKFNSSMLRINKDSLRDKRVKVIVDDAYNFIKKRGVKFDVIIADFPDPHDETITKLYTVEFFMLLKRRLAKCGIFVSQSTSPLFASDAFWCINNTMKKVFPSVIPYHVFIPTFGDWGYNMASMCNLKEMKVNEKDVSYRYFSSKSFEFSKFFTKDMDYRKTKINTFNKPILYTYYLKGWRNTDY